MQDMNMEAPPLTSEAIGNDVFKDDRKNVYFNPDGADRPLKSPIPFSVVEAARAYRMKRLRQKLAEHDCDAELGQADCASRADRSEVDAPQRKYGEVQERGPQQHS